MSFCCVSLVPALLLTFIAADFSNYVNVAMSSGSPKHSSLGIHGMERPTHLPRVARASDIILRYSVTWDETSKILLFSARFL